MVASLMRCGGRRQIDRPDDKGRTPLHIAVGRGNVAVAKALIRAGASLEVEPRLQDGTIVGSPLRLAIKGYSDSRWFKMADVMLDKYWSTWDKKQDRYCESVGLLKDLILHFNDNAFDNPVRAAARTNKLMVKLLDLGVDVNEPDEDGNTLLHLLVKLLYPAAKDAKRTKTTEKSRMWDDSADLDREQRPDPESVFHTCDEYYVHMRGDNFMYQSDSEFNDTGTGVQDSGDDGSVDGDDSTNDNEADDNSITGDFFGPNSMRVMGRKGHEGENPQYKPSGLAKRGRATRLDRADAWILSFYIVLSESKCGSLLIENKAGETPLDLIRGLKDCRARDCPKPYRRIINPLSTKFTAEDPLCPELLNKLTGSSVIPKKYRPFFFVYNRKGCYLVVPRPGAEGMRRVELGGQGRARYKWDWVPFW
ncbi:hypothetical protein DHEL01_v211665 [Diaporthe helianthi]|uniref:Uncharacterized protein n=1 Tax=Diaporthe helianthi TaxID=158607 RepID=A0A2P5HI72_DIAHE|nr:hypothetical protein DHEL01_v211665 [Diaporthe helianthi]